MTARANDLRHCPNLARLRPSRFIKAMLRGNALPMGTGESIIGTRGGILLAARVDAAGRLVVTGVPEPAQRAATGSRWRSYAPSNPFAARIDDRLLGLGLVLILAALLGLIAWQDARTSQVGPGGRAGAAARTRLAEAPPVETVLYDTRTLPIAPESALELNAKRPRDVVEVVPARAFTLPGGQLATAPGQTALECLAQAVHYEAASESEAGQRAVAQVVLNRVRSPAFPNTVCGVVFQGWERTTGCQFSFTCDGSMRRVPSAASIARARRIAREALAGTVMPNVGNATHYHADYVVPYWAASLDKVQTIGRHIFYLMRGALGRSSAFTARYLPALEQSPLSALAIAAQGEVPGVGAALDAGALAAPAAPANPLTADLSMGKLVAPEGSVLMAPGGAVVSGVAPASKPTLRADGAGRISGGRAEGALLADERKGVLRTDRSAAPAEPRSD
jgi:spore germination cell wall hydrolase CwlJ-like protein